MAEEKKKGIFDRAVDALTSRDEKEAAEKARQAALAAEQEAQAAQQRAREAQAKIEEAEAKAKKLEEELRQREAREKSEQLLQEMREHEARLAAARAAAAVAAAPKFIAEYEVKGWDETLSHVALKYYGNATRPYWMLIYEANKEVIGDNPNIIKPGMVLKIPELPKDMKKK